MEIIRMNADDRNVAARKIYAKADGVAYISGSRSRSAVITS